MSLHDNAFQAVARAAILAQFATDGLSAPVVGHAYPNQALPFVLIGESEHDDHPIGHSLVFVVTVYSKTEGAHEAKALQSSIHTALHALNHDSGGICYTNCRQEFQTCNLDPDDETWHGVQRFRVLVSVP